VTFTLACGNGNQAGVEDESETITVNTPKQIFGIIRKENCPVFGTVEGVLQPIK
jgi:hypothetical protein